MESWKEFYALHKEEIDPLLDEYETRLMSIKNQDDFNLFLDYRDEVLGGDLTTVQRNAIQTMNGSLKMMGYMFPEGKA